MTNTKEIKDRIRSVRDTQKITNAMYLIASTKLQKAKSGLDRTRPYFRAVQGEIKRIFRTSAHVESKYLYPVEGSAALNGTYGILVITADKGLAGAYNLNVIRKVQEMRDAHPDTKLFVVGEYGRQFFQRHNIPIERSFLYTAQNPTMQRAREISAILLDMFDNRELDKIYIVYTDLKNGLNEQTIATRLLPFHRAQFAPDAEEVAVPETFEFQPSMTAVLDTLMPSYVSGFIYSALVDSFCSEQQARMTAMDSANDNAQKILDELSVQYNQVRQAAITQEITEVSAGAKAQRLKRMKERGGA
ncbi:MAG: ATP synthase F1 subunit gamma [Lachnospiraceae bacterium]|jgi:F-type H+-transporting ATPase subunit gamma